MKLVLIESPFAAPNSQLAEAYTLYAQAAMLDSLKRGEAPFLSHLLYTQVLDDKKKEERKLGIEAGLAWGKMAESTIVYEDYGISPGMSLGIQRATEEGRNIEYRRIRTDHESNIAHACNHLTEWGQDEFCRHFVAYYQLAPYIDNMYEIKVRLHEYRVNKQILFEDAASPVHIAHIITEITKDLKKVILKDELHRLSN